MCYLVQNDTLKGKKKKEGKQKKPTRNKKNTTALKKTHKTALRKHDPQITRKERE